MTFNFVLSEDARGKIENICTLAEQVLMTGEF